MEKPPRMVVWKTELKLLDEQVIEVPKGSVFLKVDVQKILRTTADIAMVGGNVRETVCLWHAGNPDIGTEKRKIRIVGTGHVVEDFDGFRYVGTVLIRDDTLVFHVFEDVTERDDRKQEIVTGSSADQVNLSPEFLRELKVLAVDAQTFKGTRTGQETIAAFDKLEDRLMPNLQVLISMAERYLSLRRTYEEP